METRSSGGSGGVSGYTVDTYDLAHRAGELRAVSSMVGELATSLGVTGYDVGPGDLPAALDELGEYLTSHLSDMNDKIDTVAGNVDNAVQAYEVFEDNGAEAIKGLADEKTFDSVVDGLREQIVPEPEGGLPTLEHGSPYGERAEWR